ncbi:ArsR/SmtB family transcription factor [Desmonostoc muscorum]|nr:metalloregulator ArsR/SmtB family transcription factor [Desmonostoc muscorum]
MTYINILPEYIDECQYNNMNFPKQISTCCTPLLSCCIKPEEAAQTAAIFRALGEPARLQLLSLIANQPAGEACVCELTEPLGLSQPTVSHHLKVLYEAGLLEKERRGTWIYYRVVAERIEALRNALALPQKTQ